MDFRDETIGVEGQTQKILRYRLTVVKGPDKGKTTLSGHAELTIGTSQGNDLELADPTVSRHHCVLELTGDNVRLRDLGATNGTVVNGVRVFDAQLRSGAILEIGHTQVVFESTSESIEQELSSASCFGPVRGRSLAMRRLFAGLERAAPSLVTVLLEGETGVGKGLIASAIHEMSPRGACPFVVVDCGSIPGNLIESELFGHERGAFTGAETRRAGLFESAAGGTVFLDEVGELPLELQPKLLRVLEERQIRRVGSARTEAVDVRIIAATNRDLRREVNAGRFRSDLWFRLNVARLVVPPLRDRPEDIEDLVHHFYRDLIDDSTGAPKELVSSLTTSREWAGNVRELRSSVERAIVFGSPDAWQAADKSSASSADPAAPSFEPGRSFREAKTRAVESWERGYLQHLIDHYQGNISHAAAGARMDRNHLRNLLRTRNIVIPGR